MFVIVWYQCVPTLSRGIMETIQVKTLNFIYKYKGTFGFREIIISSCDQIFVGFNKALNLQTVKTKGILLSLFFLPTSTDNKLKECSLI